MWHVGWHVIEKFMGNWVSLMDKMESCVMIFLPRKTAKRIHEIFTIDKDVWPLYDTVRNWNSGFETGRSSVDDWTKERQAAHCKWCKQHCNCGHHLRDDWSLRKLWLSWDQVIGPHQRFCMTSFTYQRFHIVGFPLSHATATRVSSQSISNDVGHLLCWWRWFSLQAGNCWWMFGAFLFPWDWNLEQTAEAFQFDSTKECKDSALWRKDHAHYLLALLHEHSQMTFLEAEL